MFKKGVRKKFMVASISVMLGIVFMLNIMSISALGAEEFEGTLKVYAQMYTPGSAAIGGIGEKLHQFADIAKAYEELHPGVNIEFVKVPSGDIELEAWWRTGIASGKAPDIGWVPQRLLTPGVVEEYLVPIDRYLEEPNPYVEGNKRWVDIIPEEALLYQRQLGVIYYFPIDVIDVGIFYNKNIFEEVGVDAPQTWAEYMDIQKKIKAAGYIPNVMPGNYIDVISWYVAILEDIFYRPKLPLMDLDNNGDVWDRKEFVRAIKKGIYSATGSEFSETWRLMKELSQYWQKGYISGTGAAALFETGKAPIRFMGSWYVGMLNRDPRIQFDWDVFWIDRVTEESSFLGSDDLHTRSIVGGKARWGMNVSKTCVQRGNLDLAIDFMRFYTAPQNLIPLVVECGLGSPGLEVSLLPPDAMTPGMEGFSEITARGTTIFMNLGDNPLTAKYNDEYLRTWQEYMQDTITLEEAQNRVQESMEKAADTLIEMNKWVID